MCLRDAGPAIVDAGGNADVDRISPNVTGLLEFP